MPPFKAIIVGGGPVGLAMGHALALAGLDFVILERAPRVAERGTGASLALWPHSARVLDQFGLLDEARAMAVIMRNKRNHGPDGRELSRNNMFEVVEQNHGHPWMLFSRSALLDLLARRLPGAAARIKTGKTVVRIESDQAAVAVHCADGSVERGSIVIGCDGVHSRVRSLMDELAAARRKEPQPQPQPQRSPMRSSYQALVGYAPRPAGLEPATVYEARCGAGSSFHVLTGPTEAYFFAYHRLAAPTTERRRYGDTETAALAEKMRDGHITEDVRFGHLWDQRTWSVLTDLQEGNSRTWWYERVVLVGDAVHKMTPNAGFSMNTGWQGVVELTNRLRTVVRRCEGKEHGEAEGPTVEELAQEVFSPYQRGREAVAKHNLFCSGVYTRVSAWQNWVLRLADWVAPYLGGDVLLLNMLASPMVRKGITLDFIEERNHRTGKMPWRNKPVVLDEKTGLRDAMEETMCAVTEIQV
ncbi:hypothetical protein P8C59_004014 [Phyllachora maydis]|uniref:FAD-binding domain-containing protein n=1 Tax=Phyllachora maydis TaxID=1825666 RepID=A0AAD9I2K9_9PEZI|nr:hypothetical protein P8C59_004014 [Phyllachora maydis]